MFGSFILAIIVFGIMLAISMFGLAKFNAQSKRLNATTPQPAPTVAGRFPALR